MEKITFFEASKKFWDMRIQDINYNILLNPVKQKAYSVFKSREHNTLEDVKQSFEEIVEFLLTKEIIELIVFFMNFSDDKIKEFKKYLYSIS